MFGSAGPVVLEFLGLDAGDSDHQWIAPGIGGEGKRVYGGQLSAQALLAAARTAPDSMRPTSIHAQYLRGADAAAPLNYDVESLRTGRTAATRRVVVHQEGKPVLAATVSFAEPQSGLEHDKSRLPEERPDDLPYTGPAGRALSFPESEVDMRISDSHDAGRFTRRLWWRLRCDVPDDALTHTAVAVFVSDVYLLDAILQTHASAVTSRDRRIKWATTEHSMWLHRGFDVARWNLIESTSPVASGGRGIVTAKMIDADGRCCATVTQEALVADREQFDGGSAT